MKLFSILSIITILSFSNVKAQKVEQLKYEQLQEKITSFKQQVVVVNFWATWCAPCIEEIPAFMEVNEQYKNNPNFKMLLVSLDKPKVMENVKKFIKEKNINAEVVLLDDWKRMNEWLPAFDASWSSNIPVTFIYKNGQKVAFHDQPMTKFELEDYINEYLK